MVTVCGYAQTEGTDSAKAVLPHKLKADTLAETSVDTNSIQPTSRNPKRAALMSAVAPGLGQVYNQRYWKLPIVYAGLGATGFLIFQNRSQYLALKRAYVQDINVSDGDVSEYYDQNYSLADLQSEAERFQTNMEYSAVAFLAVYLMQIVDAAVDAHLYYFDVSEDLSLQWTPTIHHTAMSGPVNGVSIALTF